jgi:pimeloyl-ACP methyl ester carboxylesterase
VDVEGIDATMEIRSFEGVDGTRLASYVAGNGERPLVLAPGLGTHILCWKYLIEHLKDQYRIYTWDPRATYRSETPRDDRRLRVEDHASDLLCFARSEGLDRFALAGWSMGVQTSLEFVHRHPDRVLALVLINGAYEHLLDDALFVPGGGKILPAALEGLRALDPILSPATSALFSIPGLPRFLDAVGMTNGNADLMTRILADYHRMDWRTYFRMMLLLNEHSAAAYLGGIRVPTLITAGTADLMTPVESARRLHGRIAGSELLVVPGGTHYTLFEFPGTVNRAIEGFLRRVEATSASPKAEDGEGSPASPSGSHPAETAGPRPGRKAPAGGPRSGPRRSVRSSRA